jgi:hypothetical protein
LLGEGLIGMLLNERFAANGSAPKSADRTPDAGS